VVLALIGLQGAVGYTQYFTGLPAGLVWFHVVGSTLIWIAVLQLMFALRDRGPVTAPAGEPKTTEPGARRPVEPAAAR